MKRKAFVILVLSMAIFALTAQADGPAPAADTVAVPTASAPAHTCSAIKAFKDKLHQAIIAALRYPHALALHPVVGVTNVAYEYFNGKVSDVRITSPSGDKMLDRTAVAAVKDADYAAIKRRIDDQVIHDVVIVIYDNSTDPNDNLAPPTKSEKTADPEQDDCIKD